MIRLNEQGRAEISFDNGETWILAFTLIGFANSDSGGATYADIQRG